MDLKSVHVIPFFGAPQIFGGMDRAAEGICNALDSLGASVTVLTTDFGIIGGLGKTGGVDSMDSSVEVLRAPSIFGGLNRFVEAYGARGFTKLCQTQIRQADIIHFHGARSFENFVGGRVAIRHNKPYVIQPHGSISRTLSWTALKTVYDGLFGIRHFRMSSRMIATSPLEAKTMTRLGIDDRRIALVPNGLDLSAWHSSGTEDGSFRSIHGIGSDDPLVLFVGRLDFTKGIETLVLAFAKIRSSAPTAKLILVGPESGSKSSILKTCRTLGIERAVILTGPLSGKAIRNAYQTAAVTVLPSIYESFGLVALEAAAAGCPVIVSRSIGVAPYFEAIDGMVVEPTTSAIAEMLEKALTDEGFRSRERAKLQRIPWSDFAWPSVGRRILAIYESILSRGELV